MQTLINLEIKKLLETYPNNNCFLFPYCPEEKARHKLREITTHKHVPSLPGNYFIYAPYNTSLTNADYLKDLINDRMYVLVNVAKAGIQKDGKMNHTQFLFERINNVGSGNVARSILWTCFMKEFRLDHLLFRWVVTNQPGKNQFDNCFLIEQAFYSIWKQYPIYRPHLNK